MRVRSSDEIKGSIRFDHEMNRATADPGLAGEIFRPCCRPGDIQRADVPICPYCKVDVLRQDQRPHRHGRCRRCTQIIT